jgi:protein gp37
MSDLFHEQTPYKTVGKILSIAGAAQRHIFLVLTKRAHRMSGFVSEYLSGPAAKWCNNVLFGVTVENNRYRDRIDVLRETQVAHRFISFEPLLGAIPDVNLTGISWVIVGGESGPNARPMEIEWARNLRDQCKAAGVPFFMKQITAENGRPISIEEWPEDLKIQEFPEVKGNSDG